MSAPIPMPKTLQSSIINVLTVVFAVIAVTAIIFDLTTNRAQIAAQAAAERYGAQGQPAGTLTVCWNGSTITGRVTVFSQRELTLETQAGRVTLDPDSVRGGSCR